VLKARDEHTQASNSERSDGVLVIVDTATLRMTAQTFVNELVDVLYFCHSDVQLYRLTSVVEMASDKIDMKRTNHTSTECILKILLHLLYMKIHRI